MSSDQAFDSMGNVPAVKEFPFAGIPRQPALFLRYLACAHEALSFYRHPPTLDALHKAEPEVQGIRFAREALAEILIRQNESRGIDDSVRRAIDTLVRPRSVAVLTGQQVGVFTGPALTIYKALTAMSLSSHLRSRGIDAVPVFWMASDDHDLAEITRMTVAQPHGPAAALDARELIFGSTVMPPHPVGAIRIPESITRLIEIYCSSLSGPSAADIKSGIASTYLPGSTFSEAFGKLMAHIFRGRGLILFDPRDRDAKKLAGPVIRTALAMDRELRAALRSRENDLRTAGFAPQVTLQPRSTLVFLEEETGRRLLITGENDFAVKGTDQRFAPRELLRLADDEPWRFSPNVLLRPLVQDHLFPTIAYVGGPAEISYFAQLEPLYRFYGRPMPVVWPRSSFTVLDPESRTVLDQYGLALEDVLGVERFVLEKMRRRNPPAFEEPLSALKNLIEDHVAAIKPLVTAVDPSLGQAAETMRRKLLHRAESLHTKFLNHDLRRNSQLHHDALHLLNCSRPAGNLQERAINFFNLVARHGPSLIDTLYSLISPGSFTHKIVCPG